MRRLSIVLLALGCHHDVPPSPVTNHVPTSPPADASPPPTECEAYVQAYERAMACKQLPAAARATLDQDHADWGASVAEAGLDNPGYDPDSAYEQGQRENKCHELSAALLELTRGACP